MVLETNHLTMELHNYISVEANDMILESGMGDGVSRVIFEIAGNGLYLDAVLDKTLLQKIASCIESELTLETGAVYAIKEAYAGGSHLLELLQSSADTHVTQYLKAGSELYFDSDIGSGFVRKSMSAENDTELKSSMRDVMLKFIAAEPSGMELSGAVSALLTMYRKLFDMDSDKGGRGIHLSAFDGMSLEDIDFIEYE
jgi:hypothetical protein